MDVRIRDVSKEFERFAAVDHVSLDIASGELVALLGPSGSGKTTLLRLIAGLEFPTNGKVFFGAEDASKCTVQERHVGFVFQHYALFRHMTAFENIAFGLRVRPRRHRPSEAELRETVMRLLDLVQLSGLEQRYPRQLSGGQRQRVALARALAIEPRMLLLDEPFGALDAKVRRELRRWLREIHDRTGHTTVFVTHDQEEAMELADRVVVMNKGRIEQIGTPDEIYDRPATPFVFSFIGEASEVPVMVANHHVYIDERPLGINPNGHAEGPATLFFRPHHAEVVHNEAGAVPGIVCAMRRHGGTRRLELEVGMARHRIEVDVPAENRVPIRGRIAVKPTRWALFKTNNAA
jgi:sulfate transport system ATP-binding protein